ncbi:baeRF3 domain-containing protein [Azospirillum argentinense]
MFCKHDLERLLTVDAAPAVSIFLPTHIAGRDIRQDVIRLRNLLAKAQDQLCEKHGLRRPDAEAFLKPASDLLEQGEFWRHMDRGLAIFLARGVSAIHRVPVELPEEVVVNARFTLRPLLPLLADDGTFMILAVTAGRARLFCATRHGIAEEDAGLPQGVAEIHAETNFESNLHSAPPARHADRTDRGGVSMVKTHNFGEDPEGLRKAHLIEYLGRVAGRARDHLKPFRGPLVLVADEEVQGHLRKDAHLQGALDEGVVTNPDALDVEELHRRAYAVVRPMFESTRRTAVERFKALHGDRNTAERTTTRAEDVMVAAREGRVGVLLVAGNEKVWGHFREDYHRAFPLHHETDGAIDLVEEAATETLLRGGEVHVVTKEELPSGASTAAILRF